MVFLTSVNDRGHGRPLLLGSPLGHQDVHGREGQTSAEAHQDPHQDEVLESGFGANRTEESRSDVEDDGHEEDPLAAVQFGHATSGHLGDQVTPKVGSKNEALVRFRPEQGSIVSLKHYI